VREGDFASSMSLAVMDFRIRETTSAITMIPRTRSPGTAAADSHRVSSSVIEDWDGDYTTHAPQRRLDARSFTYMEITRAWRQGMGQTCLAIDFAAESEAR
jgi:hypothetical protein